jgi:hypothetical protein
MTFEWTVIGSLLFLGFVGTLAIIWASGKDTHERPIVVQPKVTSLEARRRLLEKAQAEQDWYAEHARG